MFVVVSTYRAKDNEEDAVIALHEDWQRNQGIEARNDFSWELLRSVDMPREFISIAHFASKELAQATAELLKQDAWYGRLVSLLEEEPKWTDSRRVWQKP